MKHEKALLVVVAYIVGFITAFIAFGLQGSGKWYESPDFRYERKGGYMLGSQSDGQVSATVKSDGFYAIVGGQERILSAAVSNASPVSGYHYQIIASAVSPNNNYIYYCAEQIANATHCASFVYVVGEDTTYKVKANQDDAQLLVPIENLKVTWSDTNRLKINNYLSSSESAPWKVAGKDIEAEPTGGDSID